MADAAGLIAERDADEPAMITGSATGGESHEPWNVPAADAYFTAHEGVRRLRTSLELQLDGHASPRAGGSDGATDREIRRIAMLGARLDVHEQLPADDPCRCGTCRVTALLDRWIKPILILPAIDTGIRWSPIQGDPLCPYCGEPALRRADKFSVIACHNPECGDRDGNQPVGRISHEPHSGEAAVLWQDGRVST